MADIVNLNRFRKAKRRADDERQAEANRIRHGQTKATRSKAEKEADTAKRELDDKRLE